LRQQGETVSPLTLVNFASAQRDDKKCCLLTSPMLTVSASGKEDYLLDCRVWLENGEEAAGSFCFDLQP